MGNNFNFSSSYEFELAGCLHFLQFPTKTATKPRGESIFFRKNSQKLTWRTCLHFRSFFLHYNSCNSLQQNRSRSISDYWFWWSVRSTPVACRATPHWAFLNREIGAYVSTSSHVVLRDVTCGIPALLQLNRISDQWWCSWVGLLSWVLGYAVVVPRGWPCDLGFSGAQRSAVHHLLASDYLKSCSLGYSLLVTMIGFLIGQLKMYQWGFLKNVKCALKIFTCKTKNVWSQEHLILQKLLIPNATHSQILQTRMQQRMKIVYFDRTSCFTDKQ